MTPKITIIIFSFMFFCCEQYTEFDDYPDNGKSVAKIENQLHSGIAKLSSRTIGEFNFRSINLIFEDSIKIEILSEEFFVGIFTCDPTQVDNTVIFTLQTEEKRFYSAREGLLNIEKVTSDQIIGEFLVILQDATASCSDCPETLSETDGKFNAVKYD